MQNDIQNGNNVTFGNEDTLRFIPEFAKLPDDTGNDISEIEQIAQQCKYYSMPLSLNSSFSQALSVLHINARSLAKNFDHLVTLITQCKVAFDIICISESWLSESLVDNFAIPGYVLLNACLESHRRGKGAALYIKDTLNYKPLDNLSIKTPGFQSVFVEICNSRSSNTIVGTMYRSPTFDPKEFLEYVDKIMPKLTTKRVILAGDFNLDLAKMNQVGSVRKFVSCLMMHGFVPTIMLATRVTSLSKSIIDNIFINDPHNLLYSGVLVDDISDHLPIFAIMKMDKNNKIAANCNHSYSAAFNYAHIEKLGNNVKQKLAGFNEKQNPEECALLLTSTIKSELDRLSKRKKAMKHEPVQPWITPSIVQSINVKNKLHRKFVRNPTVLNESNFKQHRNRLKLRIQMAKQCYFQNKLTECKENPRRLWATLFEIIQRKKKETVVPSAFEHDGQIITDKQQITEEFNNFFSTIGPKLEQSLPRSQTNPLSFLEGYNAEEHLQFETVSNELVMGIIKDMNMTGAGADGINARLLKKLSPFIISEITHLMNICIRCRIFPKCLKVALIRPLHKTGQKSLFTNYRPISILPTISKILERIICNQLVEYLTFNGTMYDYQFGFRKLHSTYMPVALMHDYITSNLTKRLKTAGLFLDLKKAFDTVDHSILLKKMEKYGITGDALKLFESYLSDRFQTTQIESFNTKSNPHQIKVGVPQGSILGPVLFSIYINDMFKISNIPQFYLYADDTALFFFWTYFGSS